MKRGHLLETAPVILYKLVGWLMSAENVNCKWEKSSLERSSL